MPLNRHSHAYLDLLLRRPNGYALNLISGIVYRVFAIAHARCFSVAKQGRFPLKGNNFVQNVAKGGGFR